MEVRCFFRRFAVLTALPLLLSISLPAAGNPSGNISNNRPVLLAGPIGKSSSASARVTLVIPARPTTSLHAKNATADQKQTRKTEQNTGNKSEN